MTSNLFLSDDMGHIAIMTDVFNQIEIVKISYEWEQV